PDRRARARCRRLRHEAVLAARAGGPGPDRPAPLDSERDHERADRPREPRARCRCTRGPEGRQAPAPDGEGVRPALVLRLASTPGLFTRAADGQGVGLRARVRYRHRHRPRSPAAREDRGRPVEAAAPRDGLGRRLPVLPVIVFALIVAGATLAAGLAAALALKLLPSANLRLAGLALVSVTLPLAAVAISGTVMFTSGHALTLLFAGAASSSAAVFASLVVARSIARPVQRLRSASTELAAGDLGARAPESGPRELAELGEAFNEMASNLEKLFDVRSRLVAWASHDLRTPLASMQAMLEAIEDGLAEPEQYLPSLREQVRALSTIVDDLFELSRIDAGVLTLELAEARLGPLVEACLRGLEPEAHARKIKLNAEVNGAPPVICAPDKVE